MKTKAQPNLVCQYLENISRKALEKYQDIIRKYVRGRHGVYALYRKNKLYYVGLASNLRSRLRHHLQDRHAQAWDRFGVYLTIGDQHLRELEALVLRIIDRKGNRKRGKFGNAEDLRRKFRRDFKRAQSIELEQIFCGGVNSGTDIEKASEKPRIGRKLILATFVDRRFHIRFRYKGKLYIAYVRGDGSITFAKESAEASRLQGKIFTSPSSAARAVTKREMNGWTVWTYERAPGDWVILDELRKK
jgi:predicted GIY-YIG superfamily endonuclease